MEDRHAREALRAKIDRLPLVDVAAFDIIGLLNDPNSTYDQVVDRLSPDIAARFLNLANSAYYGLEVRSIGHAVKLLGFNAMRQVLITSFLIEHFTRHLQMERFDFEGFQARSQLDALLAKALGDIIEYRHVGDLYTAAFLNNLGELVLAVHFPEAYRQIAEAPAGERCAAERRLLGADRYEIGAMVLERFNIPPAICNAIRRIPMDVEGIHASDDLELESALRKAVAISTMFEAPAEEGWKALALQMKRMVPLEREIFREAVSMALKQSGYLEIFPKLLGTVAERMEGFLAGHLRPAAS